MSKQSLGAAHGLCLFAFAISQCFAQPGALEFKTNAQKQHTSLDPVVVTAARLEQQLSEVIPSVSVINREQIEESQALDLAGLLMGEPGFEIGRNGGPGATTSIFLRGMSSVNSVVFIDGVKAPTDRIGFFNFADIPLSIIDRIEIVRGNLGSLYGESAIGGAINIFTRRNLGRPDGSATLTVGSRNTKGVAVNYGGELSDYRFHVDVSTLETGGFSSRVGSGYNPDQDGYTNQSVNLRLSKKLTSKAELGIFANSMLGKSESDNLFVNTEASDYHLLKRRNDAYGIYLELMHENTGRSRLEILQSDLKIEQFLNGTQRTFLTEGLSKGDQTTVRINNEITIGVGNKVQFGAEASKADFLGVYYPASNGFAATQSDTTRDTRAAYVGVMRSIDRWSLQGNFRRDVVAARESASTAIDVSKNSWLLGAGYRVYEGLRVTASRATAFRAPAPDEFVSAPAIRSEQHRTNEVGLSYQSGVISSRLVHFGSESTDAIVYRSTGPGSYENINVENQGWESHTRIFLGKLEARISLTVHDPRNVTEGKRLARRARTFGSIEMAVNDGRLSYGGRLYSAGSRADSNFPPEIVLSSYTTLDLFGRFRIAPEWYLGARLENAGNATYQLANTYATPSRGLFLSLQYQPRGGAQTRVD
jgi:vitamin B12 transporter